MEAGRGLWRRLRDRCTLCPAARKCVPVPAERLHRHHGDGSDAPARWLVPEPEDKTPPRQAQHPQYSAAATRLEQVSQSLASLAETVNDVYDTLPHRRENFRWVIDNTHDTLCFNCGRRDTCWKQEYAATLEGMEALRPLLEQNGGLETAQLPGQLSRCIHPAALCAAAKPLLCAVPQRQGGPPARGSHAAPP